MITTEIKKLTSCRKELTITMDKADIQQIREQQIKKVQREVQYPGFRKGKAPLHIVTRQYKDAIETYTLEEALDESLHLATSENKIYIVGQPEAKKFDFDVDGNLVSVIETDTFPEVELNNYKDFELTKDQYIITDKYVDETIQKMLRQRAEISSIDGPAEDGNILTINMQELDEGGVALVGKKYENMNIRLGEGKFDPELEKQMLGLMTGEEKNIEKIYPADFPQKEFAGKIERFCVTVKNIQRETLPELNDEFAQEIDPTIKNVEELVQKMKLQLELNYQHEAEHRIQSDLAQILVQENPVEIPPTIIDNYLESLIKDMRRQQPELNENDIRQHYRNQANFNIKWQFIKEQLVKVENLSVTDEEINKFLEELTNDNLRTAYHSNPVLLNRAKDEILERKIHDFLIQNAKVTVNEITL